MASYRKKFNVKFNFIGAPEGWLEKFSSLVNSGQVPDAFFYLTDQGAYKTYVENDIVLPLDSVVDNGTPYLNKLLQTDQFFNTKINNKFYFMPLGAPDGVGLFVRRDWMEKLNIKDPSTMDELALMFRRFTEEDPDGDGKANTVGLAASKLVYWLWWFAVPFGVTPGWTKDENGKYQIAELYPEYKQFLSWMQNIYTKGHMLNEFFLLDESQKDVSFYAGQTGCLISNGGIKIDEIVGKMNQANAKAKVDIIMMPTGKWYNTGGYFGGWSISSSAKEPYRLAKIFDYLISPEGSNLRCYGIEGVHYNITNGIFKPNYEERKKDGVYMSVDTTKPNGNHVMGVQFSIEPYIITNKGIECTRQYGSFANPDLIKKSDDLAKNATQIAYQPLNYLNFPDEYFAINKKLKDISEIYMVRIISGDISVEMGIDMMKGEFEQAGYERAQEIVQQTLK